MRKMKSLLIAAVMFFGVSSTVTMAQSKVAHVDVQALIVELPETKAAQAELKKLGEGYQSTFTNLVTEYQNKVQKYQAEAATAGDIKNEERAKEVQELEQRIQEFQTTAGQEMEKKEFELTKPIHEKIQAAIKKVAKAKGYDYVLDATLGKGILVADGPDLIIDVKKELGVK
ncbi:OmpH/Skp family outer membrane protein [Myroides injenensis]|uniref:OmpH family outer membrane protein n=1 Tax=Myroides injenensis TaxID=1183151 RepID=UPI00028850E8|nr:OmpH family outer membrane protein [Myroides injenensis]